MLAADMLRAIGRVARTAIGREQGSVGFAFVDDARMSEHHEQFKGDPSTTDVLSFPYDALPDGDPANSTGADAPYWGDIIICTDQAARQARELHHPYDYELVVLALHGTLHLLGYDHTVDNGEMRRLEERLRPLAVAAGGS